MCYFVCSLGNLCAGSLITMNSQWYSRSIREVVGCKLVLSYSLYNYNIIEIRFSLCSHFQGTSTNIASQELVSDCITCIRYLNFPDVHCVTLCFDSPYRNSLVVKPFFYATFVIVHSRVAFYSYRYILYLPD